MFYCNVVDLYHRYASSGARQSHSLARTVAFTLANQARGQNPKLEDFIHLNAAPIMVAILAKHSETDEMSDAGVGIPCMLPLAL